LFRNNYFFKPKCADDIAAIRENNDLLVNALTVGKAKYCSLNPKQLK